MSGTNRPETGCETDLDSVTIEAPAGTAPRTPTPKAKESREPTAPAPAPPATPTIDPVAMIRAAAIRQTESDKQAYGRHICRMAEGKTPTPKDADDLANIIRRLNWQPDRITADIKIVEDVWNREKAEPGSKSAELLAAADALLPQVQALEAKLNDLRQQHDKASRRGKALKSEARRLRDIRAEHAHLFGGK